MATTRPITIVLKSSSKDGKLRLDEFINSLEVIVDALKDAERRISGHSKSLIRYKITHLSQNSPATITIEPIIEKKKDGAIDVNKPSTDFVKNLTLIRTKHKIPENMDYHGMEKYVGISNLRTLSLPEITVIRGGKKIPIDDKFEKNINVAVGEDEFENDIVVGRLDQINIHSEENKKFYIYPNVGAKKLICKFPDELMDKVKNSLGRRIEVKGKVRYKSWDKYPYAINVEDILEIYPEDKDLPEFSLAGLQKDITGGLDSSEFIRQLREQG